MFLQTEGRRIGPAILAISALFAAVLGTCRPASAAASNYVLAISWQPAFCETRPNVRECRDQDADRADARQFSLHGLWPQPMGRAYCGVDQSQIDKDKAGRWRQLSMDRLPAELWNRLKIAMPGTRSGLERHEWLKHGTCISGATPEDYFAGSLALLDAVNASALRDLFAGNVGGELTSGQIREAFEAAFGAGAGDRVRIACRQDGDRRIILELTIGLSGEIGGQPDLAAMIAAAPRTDPGCPGGIVDAVGLQ